MSTAKSAAETFTLCLGGLTKTYSKHAFNALIQNLDLPAQVKDMLKDKNNILKLDQIDVTGRVISHSNDSQNSKQSVLEALLTFGLDMKKRGVSLTEQDSSDLSGSMRELLHSVRRSMTTIDKRSLHYLVETLQDIDESGLSDKKSSEDAIDLTEEISAAQRQLGMQPVSDATPEPSALISPEREQRVIDRFRLNVGGQINVGRVCQWPPKDIALLAKGLGVTVEDLTRSAQTFSIAIANYQNAHADDRLGSDKNTRLAIADGILGLKTWRSIVDHLNMGTPGIPKRSPEKERERDIVITGFFNKIQSQSATKADYNNLVQTLFPAFKPQSEKSEAEIINIYLDWYAKEFFNKDLKQLTLNELLSMFPSQKMLEKIDEEFHNNIEFSAFHRVNPDSPEAGKEVPIPIDQRTTRYIAGGRGISVTDVPVEFGSDPESRKIISYFKQHVGVRYVYKRHDCYGCAVEATKNVGNQGQYNAINFKTSLNKIQELPSGTLIKTPHASMNGTGHDHWGVLIHTQEGQPRIVHFSGTKTEAICTPEEFFRNVAKVS